MNVIVIYTSQKSFIFHSRLVFRLAHFSDCVYLILVFPQLVIILIYSVVSCRLEDVVNLL